MCNVCVCVRNVCVYIILCMCVCVCVYIIGASLSEPHSIVAIDEISVYIYVYIYVYTYGGQLSVYLVILITPTGCDKLNCIAMHIAQSLLHCSRASCSVFLCEIIYN